MAVNQGSDVIRPHGRWGRAVVVGGGFAGLVAARVLADFFADVVILEQDRVDEHTGVHPHVPQGYHAHAVLAKGAQVLEQLFPGLRAELREAGAPVYDYGERISFLLPSGLAPHTRTGVQIQSMTRDELERCLRRRVLALPGVTVRSGIRGLDLVTARAGTVTGVMCRPAVAEAKDVTDDAADRDAVADETGAEELDAELVVDASGRAGGLAGRLERLHVEVPAARVVKAKITYTSTSFARPPDNRPDFDIAYQMAFAPHVARGGVLLAVERDRWVCSLFGFDDEAPPTDADGYLNFAKSLANPLLAAALAEREGQDDIRRYTNTKDEWNQYHKCRDWPERLIAIGDSLCVFNPVYGQGLTVAALEADLLRRTLDRRRSRKRGLDGLSKQYQRGAARLILGPWTLSSSSDLMWHPGRRPASARAAHWYNKHLFQVCTREPRVWKAFVEVVNMTAPPTRLFRPTIAAKVLGSALRSQTEADQR